MKTIRAVIAGRVQGVGFRAWTVGTASNFGLKGWVRNRTDSTVEAVFHGKETQVTAMLEACKQGPAAARVTSIEQFDWDEVMVEERFIAKPTV